MLRKLKTKIICINVLLCGVLLLGIVSAACANSYRVARSELENGLRAVLTRERGEVDAPPFPVEAGMKQHDWQLDSYTILETDASGQLLGVKERNASMTEEEREEALAYILACKDPSGIWRAGGLMFVRRDTPSGIRIALSGTGGLTETLLSSIAVCAALFLGGILVTVCISVALAALAVRPVEIAWMRQKQFVADASHELKTPLTVILANTGILLSHAGELGAEQRQWLVSTDEEAKRMRRMIEQLLELARSDAEQQRPVFAAVDLSGLLEGCALCFEPSAYEKAMTIRTEIAPDVTAVSDAARLEQLFRILLDNAVKYGAHSTDIAVTLHTEGRRAIVGVADFGTPILPGELPHLFDRFYRADKARGEGGFGLGLSIARSIAELLGASIRVSSDEEHGTVFTVLIPLQPRLEERRRRRKQSTEYNG
ncbi:MAG: sensor histidine kinase [Eubacteriales bacterium]